MKTIFTLLLIINSVLSVKCQPLNSLFNNSGITYSSKYQNKNNPFSFLYDPAAHLNSDKLSIGFLGERTYLLKDLSHYLLACNYPNQKGKMSMAIDYSGGVNYNKTSLLLNYAHSLTTKSAIGMVFHSQVMKMPFTRNEYNMGACLGVNFDLSDQWSSSFYFNDVFYNSSQTDPSILSKIDFWCNLKCDITQSFYLSSTLLKPYDQKPNLILGFMYHFKKKLFLKYGFSGVSNQMYAGVAFAFDFMNMEIVNSFHPQLGMTPSLSFVTNSNP